jgi:single-strand DNA-binding protein
MNEGMSNAYNHVTIIGNLCNEPEFATTQSGISRVNFRVGVQRRFKDKQTGQKQADFISVVAWRNTADFVRQYMHKGDLVVVDGEIQTRSYDAQDGSKRYVTEINAEDVRRPIQRAAAQSGGGSDEGFVEVEDTGELPF